MLALKYAEADDFFNYRVHPLNPFEENVLAIREIRLKFAENPINIMANENEILKRIKEKVGIDMNKSADFDTLAQAIKDKTNESLGVNTLKRMFGCLTLKEVDSKKS